MISSSCATPRGLGQCRRPIASMVQDKDRVSLWISPGKHGRQIREKYFRAGKPCPVLISLRP